MARGSCIRSGSLPKVPVCTCRYSHLTSTTSTQRPQKSAEIGHIPQILLVTSYHFNDGWAVSTSPNITADWISSGEKWTVPVGGGFSKVVRLGDQPVKLALESYYNAVRPKAGNDTWLMQFTVTLQFPK